MGDKLSKISCVKPSKSKRQRRKNRRTRQSFEDARNEVDQCSVYEAIRRDMLIDRNRPPSNASNITRRTANENEQGDKILPKKSISQVVLLPTKELNALQRHESVHCVVKSPEKRNVGDGKCEEENKAELMPDTSKKIGNSIELLHCPDMSTISMQTEPSCMDSRRGSLAGGPTSVLNTPSCGQNMEDLTTITEMEDENVSNTTLTVPPNSVNSQFISGITPLDSIDDQEFYTSAENDSVFAHDSPFLRKYYLDGVYYTQYQSEKMFINNNSITTSLECTNQGSKNKKHTTGASSFGREVSDGPGLDSDFGASAGIEMRIVSSDLSESNNNTTRLSIEERNTSKKNPPTDTKRPKKYGNRKTSDRPSPRAELAATKRFLSGQNLRIAPMGDVSAVGLPVMQMTPRRAARNGIPLGLLFRDPGGLRRPATISGAELPSFHVTMEWDPYDTEYGTPHWMEYFIPGVSYPPYPALCDDQYWM